MLSGSSVLMAKLHSMVESKTSRKRRRESEPGMDGERPATRRRIMEESVDYHEYMAIPDDRQRKARWHHFYIATSKEALRTSVCGVCGRELWAVKDGVKKINWHDFPGKEKLFPKYGHAAHRLLDGCLLCDEAVEETNNGISVQACSQCLDRLRSDGEEGPPPLSLANGLWIGDIPDELKDMTVPEQKLIGLVYPRMHVYKLYPKKYCGEEGLQRAMRGTLSTYALNTEKIMEMEEGKLMPRDVRLLPSVISVLFVGRRKLPKEHLKYLLRVRRDKVRAALLWLKRENPKYYGNIEISEERLASLPDDDVPNALMEVVRMTDNESIIDSENGGYVPTEEDLEESNDDRNLTACADDNGEFNWPLCFLSYLDHIVSCRRRSVRRQWWDRYGFT